MDKMCKECNEVLTKGLFGPDPFKGVYTVILNYNKKYDNLKKPIISPYVCKKCGYTEWYTDIRYVK